MGKYFGRQPRYSQQEAEAQAKAAIDAAVQQGRPPDDDWRALGSRMGEINRELATRPPVDVIPPPPPRRSESERAAAAARRPLAMNEILRPRPAPEPEPEPQPEAPPPPPPPQRRSRPAAAAPATAPAKRASRAAPAAAPVKRAAKSPAAPPAKRATKAPAQSGGAAQPQRPRPAAAKRPTPKKRTD